MNRNDLLIEAEELKTKLSNPGLRIYDATILFFRKPGEPTALEEYKNAHIPGAAFFDHQDFSDQSSQYIYTVLPKGKLAKQIGKIGINKDSEIVFYTSAMLPCATRAWWILYYAGHTNVRVLNGGLDAWEKAGGKLEQGTNQYAATVFEANLRMNMFATREEVFEAMGDTQICTVNTLEKSSFEKERIEGSSLLPFSDLTKNMASFLPDDVLASRLQKEAEHLRIITYCGGGIAATTNAMAHLISGNENVAVYDGSMDEWVKEGLPTAEGK